MQFIETPLAGAYVIELDRLEDARGFFGAPRPSPPAGSSMTSRSATSPSAQ
jgi:hypothetical protein